MLKRRCISWLLGAAILMFVPSQATRAFAQNCGPFADVPANNIFCPFILQAFITSVTQGTSPTTFSPGNLVSRDQMVTFFDKGMDLTLRRGTIRTAIGKTWFPSSTAGGISTDVGGAVVDIVSDGHFLWVGRNDGKILKVNVADRRTLEQWSLTSGLPRKLGLFAGLVWIADDQGALHFFDPAKAAGNATVLFGAGTVAAGFPALAFDGTNVWLSSSSGTKMLIYQVSASSGFSFNPGASNVLGQVFDGTNMWVLLANATILKMTIPTAAAAVPAMQETVALPGNVTDSRMLFDGNNIWIPSGFGTIFVVRPTTNQAALASSVVKNEAVPDVGFPYVASFDGENVMIGGVNNGTVALYKSTDTLRIRTIVTGAGSVRGIASDGRTFNVGDALGTKFFQY
jgi:hypothetical protein